MSNVISGAKVASTTTVTILVDRERNRLERAAAASERSLGAEVRVALKRHLGHTDDETEEMA
jgi:hypothetical protein